MMKIIRSLLLVCAAFVIGACSTTLSPRPETTSTSASSSGYSIQAFRIKPRMVDDILERHLETVNALRSSQGLVSLQYSPELTAAAQRHAADIFAQKRAWHFGTDGSSPIDRAFQAGFPGALIGENLSETYEDDQVTLQAWLRDPNSRAIILDPQARYIALSWFQESNAKIWWVQMVGSGPTSGALIN